MTERVPVRIGYVDGQSKRVNERAIDSRWTRYLAEFHETVGIPPLAFMRLFGGSFGRWHADFPGSLEATAESLDKLCRKYDVSTLYVNMPTIIPYLLMARNYGMLDVGLLLIAHSVATPFWLRQWLGIAPWLTGRDLLLSSTESCTEALCGISPRFAAAKELPLCIEMRDTRSDAVPDGPTEGHMLAIGRIERVKNIDVLIECFADVRRRVPHARLSIAGEFTGADADEIARYAKRLSGLVEAFDLAGSVRFTGPVEHAEKERLFRETDVLLNLSTEPGETFGYNLIEAKTWGIPVVCTSWDGFRSVVRHGEEGWLADCDWSGGVPEIDRGEVVDYTVRLLTDRSMRERMGRRAAQRACEYDYRTVMPRLAAELALRSGAGPAALAADGPDYPVVGPDEVTRHASIPLRELGGLYRIGRLAGTGLLDETALSVLAARPEPDYEAWMGMVKPIIHHFAGRGAFAKLSSV